MKNTKNKVLEGLEQIFKDFKILNSLLNSEYFKV